MPPPELPPGTLAEGFDLGGTSPRIRFRPELGFSSKPVIGPVITGVKKLNLRLLFYVLDDLARQADDAVTRLETALVAETKSREDADAAETAAREDAVVAEAAARERLRATLRAEIAAREMVQNDVRDLSERIGALAETIERLQLAPRLARLERARRPSPTPAAAAEAEGATAPVRPVSASAPFDYLAFEARFRPETSVYEQQAAYVELLRGRERVVDLGCGRGELLELLRDEGVSAYGVEIEDDFVDLLREKGIEVVVQDALAHLASLEPGCLDGIVAIHMVEHLPGAEVSRLVTLAADCLREGGVLILETPNPESLVAGSINFHRDLTHVRPIHPDTLAFLCENAGLVDVDILRLSPVPEDELLPKPADGDPVAPVVERLNALLYGFQDYAVVARKASAPGDGEVVREDAGEPGNALE